MLLSCLVCAGLRGVVGVRGGNGLRTHGMLRKTVFNEGDSAWLPAAQSELRSAVLAYPLEGITHG